MEKIKVKNGKTYKFNFGDREINIKFEKDLIEVNGISNNLLVKPQYANQIAIKFED